MLTGELGVVLPFELSGMKMTRPPSSGLPANVTSPETGLTLTVLADLPQPPARTTSKTGTPRKHNARALPIREEFWKVDMFGFPEPRPSAHTTDKTGLYVYFT